MMTNKENKTNESMELNGISRSCFECNLSLSISKHLINIDEILDSTSNTNEDDSGPDMGKACVKRRKIWHSACFRCSVCKQSLDKERSCFIYKDKIICRQDYVKMKSTNVTLCERCHYPLAASDWVRRVGPSFAYHLSCFTCDICSRELKTGEKFIFERHSTKNNNIKEDNQQPSMLSSPSKIMSHLLMCERHFHTMDRTVGQDAYATSVSPITTSTTTGLANLEYSNNKPSNNNESSFMSQDQPRFNHQAYHSHNDDQSFIMQQSDDQQADNHQQQQVFFKQHYEHHQQQQQLLDQMQHIDQLDSVASTSSLGSSSQKAANNQHAINCSGTPTAGLNQHHHSNSSVSSKSKRVRTTFTEEQLAHLQTHFQSDSNPDGQDLERIATITGLSKRVTQVWFQNSRARQKKYMIKRKPGSSGSVVGSSCTGAGHQLLMENNNNNNLLDAQACSSSAPFDHSHHGHPHLGQSTFNAIQNDADNQMHSRKQALSCKWSQNSSEDDNEDDDDDERMATGEVCLTDEEGDQEDDSQSDVVD